MSDATSKKYAIAIFVLFLVLAMVVVYLSMLFPNVMRLSNVQHAQSTNSELVNLPRIESSVTSSEDGVVHDITIDFTLAVNEAIKADLDTATVQAKISQTMGTLDYAKINDVGGMDYIKTEIIRELDGYINTEDFRGLYIREIRRAPSKFDGLGPPYEAAEITSDKPKASEILESMRRK